MRLKAHETLTRHLYFSLVYQWDGRLPAHTRDNIREPSHEIYLSVVSVWEVIVKYQLGKLPLPESPELFIPAQRERHMIASLALDEASVSRLITLPSLHRDPFDRMVICQAIYHNLTIATVDSAIRLYPIDTI